MTTTFGVGISERCLTQAGVVCLANANLGWKMNESPSSQGSTRTLNSSEEGLALEFDPGENVRRNVLSTVEMVSTRVSQPKRGQTYLR